MSALAIWPVQDAKARFSELLDTAMSEGPQIVSKRGVEAAVLVPIEEWKRLQALGRRGLKQLLLAPEARIDLPELRRRTLHRRAPVDLAD